MSQPERPSMSMWESPDPMLRARHVHKPSMEAEEERLKTGSKDIVEAVLRMSERAMGTGILKPACVHEFSSQPVAEDHHTGGREEMAAVSKVRPAFLSAVCPEATTVVAAVRKRLEGRKVRCTTGAVKRLQTEL